MRSTKIIFMCNILLINYFIIFLHKASLFLEVTSANLDKFMNCVHMENRITSNTIITS